MSIPLIIPHKMSRDRLDNNYINISKKSVSELGRRLSLGFNFPFSTGLGDFKNMRSAMEYIFIPNYPERFLKKSYLTEEEINRIPKRSKEIPNYWAALAHLFICRIKPSLKSCNF